LLNITTERINDNFYTIVVYFLSPTGDFLPLNERLGLHTIFKSKNAPTGVVARIIMAFDEANARRSKN